MLVWSQLEERKARRQDLDECQGLHDCWEVTAGQFEEAELDLKPKHELGRELEQIREQGLGVDG